MNRWVLFTLLFCIILFCIFAGAARAQAPADERAFLQGFLPKADLGVLDFLKAHPESDGRGIVVAILDTGVDLGHPALQATSTGAPKIIDLFDGTDNGYILLPVAVRTGADGEAIRGLSGRALCLPGDLPAGTDVRLGIIVDRDYFPDWMAGRRTAERKAAWQRARESWEGTVADSSGERIDATREALDGIIEHDGDPGDRFDVAAIRRGDRWEVRIDTDRDGDLAEETALHPYREARETARFHDPANFTVALERIAPDASSIFLFFDEGGHGTHVAGIVGAYYGPDDPLNGLAPGVQFLAAKVGNGRFGGATSHNSVAKCAQWAVDHGADVINISFGGLSFFQDGEEDGARFLDELIERTGVIVCTSAGNEGPALSTIGAPGTADRIFSWGAAISTLTQQTNYSALDPRRDDLFQFTSRGPLLDGDPGIDFIAPGAALSPLPTWSLLLGESWNGTSMASPQGAGFCSLILCAARTKGIPTTPERLRRAMREGARRLPGVPVIEQGDGIPQALPTLAALEKLTRAYPARAASTRLHRDLDAKRPVVGYSIRVQNATGIGGGYYERGLRARDPYRISYFVQPDFPSDSLQSERAAFLRIVRFESDVPWMRPPLTVSIGSGGNGIPVSFDPAKMAPGLNVGRIFARDADHPNAGIEFALTATVVKPEEVDPTRPILEGVWDLERGDRKSLFVRVPQGATLARLRVREDLADPANAYEIALATQDLVRASDERGAGRRIDIAAGQEARLDARVIAGQVMEFVAFSRWHDNQPGRLAWRVEFAGVDAPLDPVRIDPDRPGAGVVIGAPSWETWVRFDASIGESLEPLEVEWRVEPDTLFTDDLNGIPAMVEMGSAILECDGGEVTIDIQTLPEQEDFLDDAFFRLYDDSGREVDAGYLTSRRIEVHPPHAGVYRIQFVVPARGRSVFDASRVVSPAVVGSADGGRVIVFRDAIAGIGKGADSLTAVTLVPGERRRFFLRGEDLPDGMLLRGKLDLRAGDGALLASIPIEADTRALVADAGAAVDAAVARALERARLVARRSDATAEERRATVGGLDRAEGLRLASPATLDDGDGDEGGGDEGADDDAPPPDDIWDLRVARMRLLLSGGDAAGAEKRVKDLAGSLPKVDPEDPRSTATRRGKEAIVEELHAEIALLKGDAGAARSRLDAARQKDPEVAGWKRVEILLLAAEGKHDDCRKEAARWMRSHPDDARIDEALVVSMIRLGWTDLAGLRLAAWPSAHPHAVEPLLRLWREAEAARGKSGAAAGPFGGI